jgi:Leucine-rich repeat (LRR) protein
MSAIPILLAVILSATAQENGTTELRPAAIDLNQCSIDTRVSTLRCISVSLDLIQTALDSWDLSAITRLDISRGALKKIDKFKSSDNINSQNKLKMAEIAVVNSGLEILTENALAGFDVNELESIDLSWNQLTEFPEVVLKLGKLRHLDLSHNKIFSLPPGSSFNSLNALATLNLNGNM